MAFRLPDHWVWDFWCADDGDLFHMYFLHAPKSLGDPDLRHRNARIGHATSPDLVNWTSHGQIFEAGEPGSYDDTATWTGSVLLGPDGLWRMYYTGSHFLSADSNANIETVGLAVSGDLYQWTKRPGPICVADARWYETYGTSSWPEEAWRDPWVYPMAGGAGWHMLLTARSNEAVDGGRGVVAHATSTDMETWTVQPPLSAPGAGFEHLEVLQVAEVDGQWVALFCCDAPKLTGARRGQEGGVWVMPAEGPAGPFDPVAAYLLAPWPLYAGRIVRDRAGQWVFLAFEANGVGASFAGRITNPMPLHVDPASGRLVLEAEMAG